MSLLTARDCIPAFIDGDDHRCSPDCPVNHGRGVTSDCLGVVSCSGSCCCFLVRAGLLVVWLRLNVSGCCPVLARGWHAARPSMRTPGGEVAGGR